MHYRVRNVNEAFNILVAIFQHESPTLISRSTSRVGDVLYIQEPVTITYTHPRERVLFNQSRDANPFFHLYESLHMLAGRNDIAPVAYYAANYAKQVQDGDSPVANGAYGYRWRRYEQMNEWGHGSRYESVSYVDQLKLIVEQLKAKPDSRRCVLQMWNIEDDLLKIDTSKDVCCNTHAYFSLRKPVESTPFPSRPITNDPYPWILDMTVCNRSNDLIWGALGANVVHFSFLQEYLAACIGCEVGVYNQFTNNLHVYVDRFEPEKWLADETPDFYSETVKHTSKLRHYGMKEFMPGGESEIPEGSTLTIGTPVQPIPLVKDPATFDRECAEFVERHKQDVLAGRYKEPFLQDVAQPMCIAFHHHKRRDYVSALMIAKDLIRADDWRIASVNWLLKRKANHEHKQGT